MKKLKCGLLGYPVKHSLSALMQQAAFQAVGLDWTYSLLETVPADLPAILAKIREEDWVGINVTAPYKQAVIPFLDKLTPEAQLMGAVNTIISKQGVLLGDNTDGLGFRRFLQEEINFDFRQKNLLIMGAGGAARAVVLALVEAKSLTMINRDLVKAQALVQALSEIGRQGRALSYADSDLKSLAVQADLIVQATSAEMIGQQLPAFPFAQLRAEQLAVDLIYQPAWTEFRLTCQKQGLKTYNGLGMLVYQGAESFARWTGKAAPLKVMKEALGLCSVI